MRSTGDAMKKAIDFDQVADLYDAYVSTNADHAFWLQVIRESDAPRLELMCGTGRITMRALREGLQVEGLDYSNGLLSIFRDKLQSAGLQTHLYAKDARCFELPKTYGLIYIGFHSISEVVSNTDKLRVFQSVHRHLAEGGHFWLSTQNPTVRSASLDGVERSIGTFQSSSRGPFELRSQYHYDPKTGLAEGKQRYLFRDATEPSREVELAVCFHLIELPTLIELLRTARFQVVQTFGNYDHSAFDAQQSPFCLLRCAKA